MGKFSELEQGSKIRMTEDCDSGGYKVGDEFVVTRVTESGVVFTDKDGDTRFASFSSGRFERVPAWQPKVGERVLFINDNPNGGASYGKKGEEVIVAKKAVGNSHYGPQVQIKHPAHDWNPSAPISALEPLPATAPDAAEAQPAAKEWAPKVGDKVKIIASEVVTHWNDFWSGDTGVKLKVGDLVYVTRFTPRYIDGKAAITIAATPGGRGPRWTIDRFAPVETATLTIEAGKFYKTRDGRKVGPMVDASWYAPEWKWTVEHPFTSSYGKAWRADGTFSTAKGQSDEADLVALWEEPAVAVAASNDNTPAAEQPAAKPKFKVGDRVRAIHSYRDITKGKTYEVVEVDDEDDVMPVRVLDDAGDRYWLHRSRFELVNPASTTPAIVALIENGTAKPATRPKVHADQAIATNEAERLAIQFPGQQFGVFVLADSTIAEAPKFEHEWQRLASQGDKIAAIKEIRALTGFGLKASKDGVEDWLARQPINVRSILAA